MGLLIGGAGSAPAQVPRHNCDFCHNLHGGSFAQLTDFPTAEDVCLSCHGDAGPPTVDRDGVQVPVPKNVSVHDGTRHTTPTSCWNCHDHEGEAGANLAMIPASRTGAANGTTRAVVFTARSGPNSFADGDGIYNGVCEVCHTLTSQHRNDGGAGKHNAAADCRACHAHEGGFQGQGGRCTTCHDQAQGARRAVVGEFSRISHHVDWQAAGYLAADSIPDSDCVVCHDLSLHQQGSVRLWNVDAPGNTAQSIVLTGDPNTSTAEAAKLETFCLACHDANGADGDVTPFSDGLTRPLVDAAAWAAASHATSANVPAGCYGDGTNGCHGTAHGSLKQTLLAPAGVAAAVPALAEEQEGFCFNCHDSDGPATSDLATPFGFAINWVRLPVGLNDNPNLNDRHDVQHAAQTRSGAKVECTDCHNPHTATQAQPWVLDPDPSDQHVVGTDWYFSAYQTANDRRSEFCLDCHDGSLPAGVLGHSPTALTNIRTTWVGDGMGARVASSANLRTGTGWAIGDVLPCNACHTAHVEPDADVSDTTNLFAVRDTVRNKAGTAYLFFQDRSNDPQIFRYAITDNQSKADSTSGGYWCNTCHDRTSMTGKENCYACHRHGDGGRW